MSKKYLGGYLVGGTSITTPASGDPQFNYVTALLHGDGTNGAQNNTFLDSSTNNFTITRNGNTTQGTFSPFGSLWSNYFVRASSQYLTVSNSGGQFSFGTGAFTIECWVNLTSMPSGNGYPASYWLFGSGPPNSDAGVEFYINNTQIGFNLTAFSSPTAIGNHGISVGGWYHVAVIRGGTSNQTLSIYVNGSRVATASSVTATADAASTGIAISAAEPSGATSGNFDGYISNYRVVKGTAVYDPTQTTLTVPTSPLTAITNTQLLTCQSNCFLDNSSNAFALTVSGSPSIQRFSPFNTSTAYSQSVIGGSGYFDGSGDYLTVASNTAFNWGTGDGTMEWWFNAPSQSTNYPGLVGSADYNSSGSTNVRWDNTGYRNKLFIYINGGGDPILVTTNTFAANAWHHCAVVRASGVLYFYVDGVQNGSVSWSSTMNWSNGGFYVGKGFDVDGAQANFIGYISNVRNVKGTAVYTGSTYTVPTAPLTAITNTQLLLNYTNAGIYDNAEMSVFETVGNAQISTSVYKYGTGSMYFDGSGDYLIAPSSPNLGIGNVFTVECWLYLTAAPTSSNAMYVTDFRGGSTNNYAFGVINSSSNTILYAFCGSGGGEVRGSTNITTNTWYHLAYVNTGSTLTGYLNGVSQGTLAVSFNQAATNVVIGARYTGSTEYVTGYIDDLRITKGYARYTTTFTPPTAALPDSYTPSVTTSILPTATSAPGIWTMDQQAYYKAQGLWPLATTTVSYLVVAGGGGGGYDAGGGGGAGGLLTNTTAILPGTTYTVTVGAGGSGSSGSQAGAGSTSSLIGGSVSVTATGGGYGGDGIAGSGSPTGGNGGSGGGGCGDTPGSVVYYGGTGVSGQGYSGGSGFHSSGYNAGGGGGGGASAVGQNEPGTPPTGNPQNAGNGGAGSSSSITGSAITYAGGGGGGINNDGGNTGSAGTGGSGGGGNGSNSGSGSAGTTNLGGGGGGGCRVGGSGGAGGSGVVIISAPTAAASTTGSPTVTTSGGNTIYKFTSSGSITF